MPSLNKVLLMGNLTRDPELRMTPKGTAICQFSLAINRQYSTESGEKKEEVTYVDIEAWGKQGETISKYCSKGRPLYVEGRLRLDSWEDKNTKEKRSRMKIVLEGFQFLGDGRGAGGERGPGGEAGSEGSGANFERHTPPSRASSAPKPANESLDEDVPF